jgi:2-phospho-L-lactate guanylyltransferase
MIAVLLPVKIFSQSKQRLAGFLSARERELLARTMFDDVWETLRARLGFDELLVASAEPYVLARCREEQVRCLVEAEQKGHSQAVREATAWAMTLGAETLLSIPIDAPGVTAEEIAALIGAGRRCDVVIVPSRDGSGTNALLRTPPDAIDPLFGRQSFALHAQEARARKRSCRIECVPGLAADIDTPEDMEHFVALGRHCRTAGMVRELLEERSRMPA